MFIPSPIAYRLAGGLPFSGNGICRRCRSPLVWAQVKRESRYRGFNPARSHAGQSAAHAQPAACSTPARPVLTLLIEAFGLGKSILTTSSSLLLTSGTAGQGEFEQFYNSVKCPFVPVLNTATDTLAPPTLRDVSSK